MKDYSRNYFTVQKIKTRNPWKSGVFIVIFLGKVEIFNNLIIAW